jgi:hypothetical protein
MLNTVILGAIDQFDYDGFSKACHTIFDGLLPFAFLMAVIGIITEWSGGYGDMERRLGSLTNHVVVLVALFFWYPDNGVGLVQWIWGIFSAPSGSVVEQLEQGGVPKEDVLDGALGGLVAMEVAATVAKDKSSNPDKRGGDWTEYFQQMAGLGGILFLQYAKILQAMSMMIMGALGPIFFGMMLYESTRNTGYFFLGSTLGIAMWPLGWALCRFGTSFFEQIAYTHVLATFVVAVGASKAGLPVDPYSAVTAISWSSIVSGWIVMTTIGVPGIMQGLMTFGASSVAGQMMGGARGGLGGAVGESGGMAQSGGVSHGMMHAAQHAAQGSSAAQAAQASSAGAAAHM